MFPQACEFGFATKCPYIIGQTKQVYETQVGHPIMSAKIQLVSKMDMPHQN